MVLVGITRRGELQRRLRYLLPAAALLVFALLMLAIALGATNALDVGVWLGLRRLAYPWLTHVMVIVTYLGSWPVIIAAALAYALLSRGSAIADMVYLLGATAGGGALSLLLKAVVHRPRPNGALVWVSGFSFPSGHALLSLVFYGTLVRVLASRAQSRRRAAAVYLAGVLLIATIGFSRLYLGVHYLTDVLASYAIGVAWVSALALLVGRRFSKDRPPACAPS